MDWIMSILLLVAGGLVSYIFFSGDKVGPFEQVLWAGLAAGKRVIISVDEDSYIFEMVDGRMKITRGVTTYTDEPPMEDQ